MLEPGTFRHSRAIAAGDAGLSALVLDAAALADSRGPRGRFADVRIVDANGRQVPYLVERRDEPLPVDLAIRADASPAVEAGPGHRSVYRVALPFVNLPEGRLVLDTSARVFHRQVQAAIERPADRRRRGPWLDVVAASPWTHVQQDTAAQPLVLPLRSMDAAELVVVVEEGDNATLPITRAALLLPSYRLRFYRQDAGALRLLYGRDDLAVPRYDLALLAPQVMGGEARETTAALPDTPAASGAAFVSPRVFWAFLAGAVLVLLALVARLVTRPGD
jgi:hypothetical protein